MLLSVNITISAAIIFIKHPLSIGAILIIQTITVALIVGIIRINFWFSYILVLIIIGGILILFIYITRIASNEKFKFSPLLAIYITIIFSIRLVTAIIDQYLANIKIRNLLLEEIDITTEFQIIINKYINWPNNILLYLTVTYLFITLIAVVKITNIKQGPLRQAN